MALTEKYVSSTASGSGNGLTEGAPFTFDQMLTEIKSASGAGGKNKRYNIKADGTYVRSTTDDASSGSGDRNSPVVLRGYKTAIGDGYQGRNDANGPLITTNMPLITYAGRLRIGGFWALESLNIQGSNTDELVMSGQMTLIVGCYVANSNTGSNTCGIALKLANIMVECDILTTATSGPSSAVVYSDEDGARILACRVISSCPTQSGLRAHWWNVVVNTLFKGAGGGSGIRCSDQTVSIFNSTITGFQHGIESLGENSRMVTAWGNMITDNTGYAVSANGVDWLCYIGPNRVRDNAAGVFHPNVTTNNWTSVGRIWPLITTDTGGPETDYVNAAGGDYNIIPASPAADTNFPRYLDMGAYNRQHVAIGGTTAVFHPIIPQIIRPAPSE